MELAPIIARDYHAYFYYVALIQMLNYCRDGSRCAFLPFYTHIHRSVCLDMLGMCSSKEDLMFRHIDVFTALALEVVDVTVPLIQLSRLLLYLFIPSSKGT